MPAPERLHQMLDAIANCEDQSFLQAVELMLAVTVRGAVAFSHLKRTTDTHEEAVRYMLQHTPRKGKVSGPPEGKGNV